jgi:hypothetical protein
MRMNILITLVKLAITSTFMLAACLLGQDRGGTPPGDGSMQIGRVFSMADASGSLEYWGVCNFKEFYPDYPKLRGISGHEGSAVESLQEMFSVDPEMRVSQDADGKIRMIEEDVPSDLLDVRIHDLRFPVEYHGPSIAVMAILKTPEVIEFRRKHNIGPATDWHPGFGGFPSDAFAVDKLSVLGDLHDVTVRQALDHVLKTFHGVWLYENCKSSGGGGRTVLMAFLENKPSAVFIQTQK